MDIEPERLPSTVRPAGAPGDLSRRLFVGGLATAAAAAVAADTRAQTPEQVNVEAFISGVRAARVFDLGFTWDQSAPLLSLNPPYAFALNATHRQTHEVFGTAPGSQVSWASEMLYMSGQHGAPTIDAIGHIGRNLKLHGGVDAVQATSRPDGIGNDLGIDAFPRDLLLSRGILLDVARVVANGAADPLPPGFEITGAHLDATAKAQGVEVRPGDSLLIRTGWGQFFGKDNGKFLGEQSPGPGQDAARWIIDHKVRLAGDDTATFEKRPAAYGKELFSVHMMLLADNGIYIVENMNLEPLAAARVYTIALVITPLKIQGATGSPLRAIALAP
jgi:kynurenine formamidase